MNTSHAVRMDASPISVVAAQARVAAGETASGTQDVQSFEIEKALNAVSRKGYDAGMADAKARALPRRMWLILAAGLVAWALVAIPAFLVFG